MLIADFLLLSKSTGGSLGKVQHSMDLLGLFLSLRSIQQLSFVYSSLNGWKVFTLATRCMMSAVVRLIGFLSFNVVSLLFTSAHSVSLLINRTHLQQRRFTWSLINSLLPRWRSSTVPFPLQLL